MRPPRGRIAILVLCPVVVFSAVAAILVRVLPEPLNETDYLVIGTVATFAALLTLFLLLLKTSIKSRDLFYKERRHTVETVESDAESPAGEKEN